VSPTARHPLRRLRGSTAWHWRAVLLAKKISDALGGRGLGRAVDALGRVFPNEHVVTLPVFGTRTFSCDASDGYWLPAALRGGGYEPEVAAMLDLVLTRSSVFVDCGANLGWWSLFASRTIDEAARVLAVEAAPGTFTALRRNAVANDMCFTPAHAALWDRSGLQLSMRTDPHRHAWASVDARLDGELRDAGFQSQQVTTTTVDDLVADAPQGELVVLKIDVEGAEVQTLRGATRTLLENAVVIYEDHGRDPDSTTTQAVVEEFGLSVFRIEPSTRALRPVGLRELAVIKQDPQRGYNLLACRATAPVHASLLKRVIGDIAPRQ
jgi:FkbM family methyltransferase